VTVIGFIGIRAIVLKGWNYDIKMPLEKTLLWRKWLFTILLFAAIVLRFKLNRKQFGAIWGYFCAFIIVRLICIILLMIPIVLFFQPANAQPVVMTLISTIILLCMPPSSILPSMVAQAHAPQPVLTEINAVTAMFNVFYIFLLAVAIILKIALLL
jgi:hypothetical protein